MANHDFWIGDRVRIDITGQTGTFEGDAPGHMAHVKVGKEVLIVPIHAVSLVEEAEETAPVPDELAPVTESGIDLHTAAGFHPVIDLHIDVLAPSFAHNDPGRILDLQLRKCRDFLEQAITFRKPWVDIIHGVGSGTLKHEVLALVNALDELDRIEHTGAGAVRVYFLYS